MSHVGRYVAKASSSKTAKIAAASREVEIAVHGSVRIGRFRRVPLAAEDGWWGWGNRSEEDERDGVGHNEGKCVRMSVIGRME